MSVRDVAGEVATDIGLGLIDRVVQSAHLLVLGAGAVALGTVAFIAAAIALVVLSPLLTTVMGETTGPQAAAALSIALFLGLAFILVRWLVMTVGRRLERITARVEEAAAELLVGDASALGRARDEG